MEELKTQGLILNANNLNDNDKIFTVLTREYGKLTAISKGIRSHKHKDFSALQNFCYSDMVLNKKNGLYYISSASVNNNFYGIRNSVEQMSFAAYFADIVKSVPYDLPFEDEYYNFILNTLYLVSKAEQKCTDGDIVEYLKRLKAVFEMKTACEFGYMPDLQGCCICNSSKNIKYFDVSRGGVICSDCKNRAGETVLAEINDVILKMLTFICMSDYKTVFSFNADEGSLEVIAGICEQYIIKCIEMYLPSLTYLKSIISGEKNV